jgi:hypothetical protein
MLTCYIEGSTFQLVKCNVFFVSVNIVLQTDCHRKLID